MGIVSSVLATINNITSARIPPPAGSVYDIKLRTIDGQPFELSKLRGRKILFVNTASRCGYTPQYEQLEELHEKFSDRVCVIGVPANDFLWQEPGDNAQIQSFCKTQFGVQFPVLEKAKATGNDAHPLFKWLAGKTGTFPTWNFCKYLVDENGDKVTFFNSQVVPTDNRIISKLSE